MTTEQFGHILTSAMLTIPKHFARFAAKGFQEVGTHQSFEEVYKLVVAEIRKIASKFILQ